MTQELNGDCPREWRCEFNAEDFGRFSAQVLEHDVMLRRLEDVPLNIEALRVIAVETRDKLHDVAGDVGELQAWRSDDKTQRIVGLEKELARRDEAAARNRERWRDRIVTAVITGAISLAVGYTLKLVDVFHRPSVQQAR